MKKSFLWIVITLSLFAFTSLAHAQQGQSNSAKAWGYFFGAPGAAIVDGGESEPILHFGGGVEGLVNGGFGIGAEIGYLAPFDGLGDGIGAFSIGPLFAFGREKQTAPFLTGGYTLFFRSGTASGVFFGGGVNHWLGERIGIRIEGRDQVMVEYNDHLIEVRFALLIK
jgi:hypothetical protein